MEKFRVSWSSCLGRERQRDVGTRELVRRFGSGNLENSHEGCIYIMQINIILLGINQDCIRHLYDSITSVQTSTRSSIDPTDPAWSQSRILVLVQDSNLK